MSSTFTCMCAICISVRGFIAVFDVVPHALTLDLAVLAQEDEHGKNDRLERTVIVRSP